MKTAPASNRANRRASKAANNGAKRKISHSGSSFDSFLDEQGIRHEVEAIAAKRVLSWQIARTMKQQQKTKQALARELRTSRSQLDRLLDPENIAVTLETVSRAAHALGKRLVVRIVEPPTPKRKLAKAAAL
jgi:antitoxin HicB